MQRQLSKRVHLFFGHTRALRPSNYSFEPLANGRVQRSGDPTHTKSQSGKGGFTKNIIEEGGYTLTSVLIELNSKRQCIVLLPSAALLDAPVPHRRTLARRRSGQVVFFGVGSAHARNLVGIIDDRELHSEDRIANS